MEMTPYLTFKGDCEAAFGFYQQSLGGTLGGVFRYAGTPYADQVPPDWQDKVMHATLLFGNTALMGADAPPNYFREPQGFSISLSIDLPEDSDRVFAALAEGGKIMVPIAKTFWTA